MRAIGYTKAGPITADDALVDIDLPEPTPGERDLLVEVKAVSVNPVDTKVRASAAPETGQHKVLGWDAAGIVRAVGAGVTGYAPGDAVYYAGSIARTGTNAQLHCVDERIVGHKPRTLDWAEAAALPLTTITAWEALFDRLEVTRPVPGGAPAVLIVGGAGGVGSIAIQLLRACTELTVIATASRSETAQWARDMGAHHVIDHSRPMAPQIAALDLGAPSFVFSTTHSDQHIPDVAELIAPQGRFALIDEHTPLDVRPFQGKAVSIHWELMFARPLHQTPDMGEQKVLLDEVARLIDAGAVRTTLTERLSPMDARTLSKAHAQVESGTMRGKVVVEGWPD
ncbi:zinc-binding alcohol dehydrogenase family protein [Paracoccus ravus]|uniref:zinc-binding alcohol dehydrogenase family protein n=1 Tax=Paracoccus ravus TaxID=2447760 RepID=UPI00106DE7C0|nr:zinc-binding alcohol dehydrogenase family protein [Paracoccus ravus]